MSNPELGADCCGDRYDCNTTMKCPCGCGLCYCDSCYNYHCRDLVLVLLREREEKEKTIAAAVSEMNSKYQPKPCNFCGKMCSFGDRITHKNGEVWCSMICAEDDGEEWAQK